jgi:hypothetical protein
MSIFSSVRKFADKLRNARTGTVAVEFALIIPFAMMIYAGGAYTSGMVTLNKKMQSAAYAMVNSVPFPRTVCSYRMHIENMYGSGAQIELMRELLYPFPVTENNIYVRYIETAPDADGKFTSRVRVEYRPTDGGLRMLAGMYSAVGGPDGLENSTVWAESAQVTVTNDIPVCPTTPLKVDFDPNAAVRYFEVLSGSAYTNTVTASGGVRFQGKYRPYSVSSLPPGLTFEPNTGKFGTAITYPCQASNPGCDPVTLPPTVFTAQDYRDKLYDSPPATATVTGQFVVYYPVTMSLPVGSGIIYQGQAIANAYQPNPTAWGGWKVGGAPKGYTFSAANLPAGLSLDANTGNIAGTTMAWPGTYAVSITARDSRGATFTRPYSLEVRAQPLQISVGNLNMTYRQPGSVAVTGMGGAGTISVSCAGMPAGMTCSGSGVTGQAGSWQQVGLVHGTPTTYGDFWPTVTITDQSGNSVSQPVHISIAMPAVSHYATNWNQTAAGTYSYAYVYVSGGSGNFSIVGCGAPGGMVCTQATATSFHWSGSPPPGAGTAWMQFRDNVTGVIYQQNLAFNFTSPPISVWAVSKWGNQYPSQVNYLSWGASGGAGALTPSCSGALPYTSGWTCYGYPATVGWHTTYMTVRDNYGQAASGSYSFYIYPPPMSAGWTTGWTYTWCQYGCSGYQNLTSSGGYGSRYISSFSTSRGAATFSFDGTNGQVAMGAWYWWDDVWISVADQAGQVSSLYTTWDYCTPIYGYRC